MTTSLHRVARAVTLVLSVCPTVRLSGQRWRPADRVHLTDFSYVTAIAASSFWVYAATTGGLTIYDRRFHRWELPVTPLDGYPAPPRRVLVALADPAQESVWLGLTDGWARYVPDLHQWESGLTGGPVRNLMFDLDDPVSGIYLNVGGGWSFLPRGGAVAVPAPALPAPPRRALPLDPATALDQSPGVAALRPVLLTDPRLHTHRFTSAARSRDRDELFLGTDGMGVLRVDLGTTEYESLPTGLLSAGVGAIAAFPGGVWVATGLGRVQPMASLPQPSARSGLTKVRADLSEYRTVEGPTVTGLGFQASRALLVRGTTLWLATERGLLRLDQGGLATTVLGLRDGLPDDDVSALAPAPDGVWVGTRRGTAHVGDEGRVTRIAPGLVGPVLSLLAVGDTLWIGTLSGLRVLLPGSDDVAVPAALDSMPEMRGPIVSLTRAGNRVVAATAERVGWRELGGDGLWTVSRPPVSVGRIAVVRGDPDGVWLGGNAGVTYWRLAGAAAPSLLIRVPMDLPAPVHDLALDGDYLWVATDAGLVRLSRQAALGR